jgi:hypothetical protein
MTKAGRYEAIGNVVVRVEETRWAKLKAEIRCRLLMWLADDSSVILNVEGRNGVLHVRGTNGVIDNASGVTLSLMEPRDLA